MLSGLFAQEIWTVWILDFLTSRNSVHIIPSNSIFKLSFSWTDSRDN